MNKFYSWQIKQGRYYQLQRKEKKNVTRSQNWREERTGETQSYLDEKKKKKIKEWLGHTYNGCVVVNFLISVIFIFALFQLH